MVPKSPLEGGEGDKAGEAIDVEQAFDFCHADIVTEFRSIAIIIPPGFFQGIFASKGKSYPLKFTKSLKKGAKFEMLGERLGGQPAVVLSLILRAASFETC